MSETTNNPKNIFLADDDEDDCDFFKDAIEELGAEALITIAKDGLELLATLDKSMPPAPYVIFLDLNMPRKDGFETLKEIRATDKFKDIPVVILSTSSNPQYIDRTFELGANYYICKPNSFKILMEAINKILTLEHKHLHTQPDRTQFVLVGK